MNPLWGWAKETVYQIAGRSKKLVGRVLKRSSYEKNEMVSAENDFLKATLGLDTWTSKTYNTSCLDASASEGLP